MKKVKLFVGLFVLSLFALPFGVSAETVSVAGKDVTVVTSGSGLYKDTYEEGRYIYRGADPNNTITFNNETWRIISVESDNTLKIIRDKSIKKTYWDSNNGNTWTTASIYTYLNNDYYNSLSSKDKIIEHNFNIGKVSYYNENLTTQVKSENATTWKGKVGLLSVSDYLRANSDYATCGTYKLNGDNHATCLKTNWLYNGENQWTISASNTGNDSEIQVNEICSDGYIKSVDPNSSAYIRPVVYIANAEQTTTTPSTPTTPTKTVTKDTPQTVSVPSTAASAIIFTTVGIALVVIAGIVIYVVVKRKK